MCREPFGRETGRVFLESTSLIGCPVYAHHHRGRDRDHVAEIRPPGGQQLAVAREHHRLGRVRRYVDRHLTTTTVKRQRLGNQLARTAGDRADVLHPRIVPRLPPARPARRRPPPARECSSSRARRRHSPDPIVGWFDYIHRSRGTRAQRKAREPGEPAEAVAAIRRSTMSCVTLADQKRSPSSSPCWMPPSPRPTSWPSPLVRWRT